MLKSEGNEGFKVAAVKTIKFHVGNKEHTGKINGHFINLTEW